MTSLPDHHQQYLAKNPAGYCGIGPKVTFTDGVETGKRRVGTEVTQEPVDRVVVVGTKRTAPEPEEEEDEESGCHPSYTGACVPFASDVDCEGGSGDGVACEP